MCKVTETFTLFPALQSSASVLASSKDPGASHFSQQESNVYRLPVYFGLNNLCLGLCRHGFQSAVNPVKNAKAVLQLSSSTRWRIPSVECRISPPTSQKITPSGIFY